jgi:ABC-type transport system involved in cytochrome bd biosynthesis fused ATPase/permease subunit
LSIRQLSFSYQPGPRVLNGLSLDLPAGHKVAILGASGAGKSTLFNLLLRFWDYETGSIELGGVELHLLPAEQVRRAFAVVPQQVHIFNASLEENLRLVKPAATQAELETAARHAKLLDFIEGQPEGWGTWAGEHGLRLSGGERQRLGVARALLRDAPILLLDEFTTHLDAATAQAVLAETLAAAEGRSVILITHSLAGLEAMDAVYRLEGGLLVSSD